MAENSDNYGIGLALNVDKDLDDKLREVENKIKNLKSNCEKELEGLNSVFQNATNGLGKYAEQIGGVANAINNVKVNKDFVNALKQINDAASKTDGVEKLAEAFSKMQAAMPAMGSGAQQASTDVSALVQQMGQIAANVNGAVSSIDKMVQALGELNTASSGGGKKGGNLGSSAGLLAAKLKEDTFAVDSYRQLLNNLYIDAERILNKISKMGVASGTQLIPDEVTQKSLAQIEALQNEIKKLEAELYRIGTNNGKPVDTIFQAYITAIEQLKNEINNVYKFSDTFDALSKKMADIAEIEDRLKTAQAELNATMTVNQNIDTLVERYEALKKELTEVQNEYVRYKAAADNAADKSTDKTFYAQQAEQYALKAKQIKEEIDLITQSAEVAGKAAQKRIDAENKVVEARNNANRSVAKHEGESKEEEARQQRLYDLYKEQLRVKEQEQQLKSQDKTGSEVLVQQNKLLNERIKLYNQLNNLEIAAKKKDIISGESLSPEQLGLKRNVEKRLAEINAEAAKLAAKFGEMSQQAQQAFSTRQQQYFLARQQQMVAYQEKYNKEVTKATELANNNTKSSLQPTSEELSAQREVNRLYAERLAYEKELQSVRNQTTVQGGTTKAQQNYIDYLNQQIQKLQDPINEVAKNYAKIADAARKSYEEDRSDMLAKKQYELAEALRKRAQEQLANTEKARLADLKAIADAIEARKRQTEEEDKAAAKSYAAKQKMYEQLWAQQERMATKEESSKELEAQRQITALYAEKLRYEKELKNIQVDTKTQGSATQAQKDYIQYLLQQIHAIQPQINAVAKGYETIAHAAREAYQSDRADYMAKKNYQLAEALDNAAKAEAALAAKNPWNKMFQDTNETTNKITALEAEINRLTTSIAESSRKAQDAATAMASMGNRDWIRDLEIKIDELTKKYAALDQQRQGKGSKEYMQITSQMLPIQTELNQLNEVYKKYTDLNRVRNAESAATARDQARLNALTQEHTQLQENVRAQNSLNAAIQKFKDAGKSVSDVVSEYKRLNAELERLQTLKASADTYQMATSAQSADYQSLLTQIQTVVDRKKEIEQLEIDEVNAYRLQKENETNQKAVADFAKSEAERKAEADKTNDLIKAGKDKSQRTYSGALAYADAADTYTKQEQAVKNLKAAMADLSKTDAQYEAKLKTLEAKLREVEKAMKAVSNAMSGKQAEPTFASAKATAEAALQKKTLNDLKIAYQQLQAVMNKEQYGTQQWNTLNALLQRTKGQIDQVKKAMGELNGQQNKVMDIAGQLGRQLAMVFSVSAIKGYIENIVQVRAQFELQRIALGAILQDTEKANEVFKQVQSMALESPFSIMQLEKATKQIAAFGVEADKLKPSIKMLADISAGLGVDIDRLILVYGHIKANNALQQLHVRQFTNAGFNIAGELAKYYSEMEDKMVSVAEVTDRIHKKMVSFADVEEVLRRVTSAGGMFYDMQKKQSDSLWGQMQRIKDQMDLMFNEIGQSNQSSISWALQTIRGLIKQWRDLAPYIKAAATALGTYIVIGKGIPMLVNFVKAAISAFTNLRAAITTATTAQQGLNAATAVNPWGALAAILASVAMYFYDVSHAMDAFTEEMNRINTEGITKIYKMSHQFEDLAEKATNYTLSFEERSKALEDIKRIYGEILPKEELELENLEAGKKKWGEMIEAIKAYELERIQQLQREAVNAEYQKQIDEVKASLMGVSEGFLKMNKGIQDTEQGVKNTIGRIMNSIEAEVLAGNIKIEDAQAEFEERFKKYYNLNEVLYPDEKHYQNTTLKNMAKFAVNAVQIWRDDYGENLKKVTRDINREVERVFSNPANFFKGQLTQFGGVITESTERYFKTLKDNASDIAEVYGDLSEQVITADTQEAYNLQKNAQQYEDSFKKKEDAVNSYINTVTTLYNLNKSGDLYGDYKDGYSQIGYAAMYQGDDSLQKQLSALNQIRQAYGLAEIKIEDVTNAIKNNVAMQEHFQSISTSTLQAYINSLGDAAKKNEYLNGLLAKYNREVAKMAGTPVQTNVQEVITAVADSLNLDISLFDKLKVDASDTFDTVRKKVKGLIDANQEIIDQWDEISSHFVALDPEKQAESVTGYTKEEISQLKVFLQALKAVFSGIGGTEKKKKTGGKGKDEIAELWKNRLQAIQDYYKRYDELRKKYDETEALDKAKKAYQSYFNELKLNIDDISARGMDKAGAKANVDALTEQVKNIRPKLVKEFEKVSGDFEMQIGVDVQTKGLEDLDKYIESVFDNYELSKTFKDLGLNIDLTYMVGGKPTTLDDVIAAVQNAHGEFDKLGTEGEKKEKEFLKKITDMEQKELQERIKNYAKYLTKSYGERGQYEIEMYTKIARMREDFEKSMVDDPANADKYKQQLSNAMDSIQKEMKTKLAEFDFKDMMGSSMFADIFQDLSNVSNKVIDKMLERVKEMRKNTEGLNISQIRQLAQYEEKLQNAKFDNGSIKDMIKALKEAWEWRKKLGSGEDIQLGLFSAEDDLKNAEKYMEDLRIVQDIDAKTYDIDKNKNNLTEGQLLLLDQQKKAMAGGKDFIQEEIDATKDNIVVLEDKVKTYKKAEGSQEAAEAAANKMANTLKKLGEVGNASIDAISAGIKLFGGDVDDSDEAWMAFAQQVISSCVTLAIMFTALGVVITSTMGIIGLIAEALALVTGLFKALLGAHDAKLTKQIKNLQNAVDDLSDAYDRLEKARDKALSTESYNTDYEMMERNINQQIRYYNQMIALEEEKKDADEDKIRDYQSSIEDLKEELEELQETRITDFGGFGESNYEDIAEDFVSTWLDAFKETGDGLDELNDKWQEYMENLFLKQAAYKKAATLYSRAMSIIDNAIDSGKSGFDLEAAVEQARTAAANASEELNEYLKTLAGVFGITQEGENTLSELQQGIENITEPQAAAIEAYLNSIRFYVASQDTKLNELVTIIREQYSSGSNPILTVVKEIRDSLNQLTQRFLAVTKNTVTGWKLQVQ